jgi:hypothetical protein
VCCPDRPIWASWKARVVHTDEPDEPRPSRMTLPRQMSITGTANLGQAVLHCKSCRRLFTVSCRCSPARRNGKLDNYPRPIRTSSTEIMVEHVWCSPSYVGLCLGIREKKSLATRDPWSSALHLPPQRYTSEPEDQREGHLAVIESHPAGWNPPHPGSHTAPQTGECICQLRWQEPSRLASDQTTPRACCLSQTMEVDGQFNREQWPILMGFRFLSLADGLLGTTRDRIFQDHWQDPKMVSSE